MSNNYMKIFTKGLQSALDTTSVEDGKLRFVIDSGKLYLDNNTDRISISNVITGYTDSEIQSLQDPLSKLYVASDTLKLYVSDGTTMQDVSRMIGTPTSTISDEYQYIWMSDQYGGPKYNTSLAYNASAQSFKGGCFQLDNSHESNVSIGDLDFNDPVGEDDGKYNFGDIEEHDETSTIDADFGDQDSDSFDIFII